MNSIMVFWLVFSIAGIGTGIVMVILIRTETAMMNDHHAADQEFRRLETLINPGDKFTHDGKKMICDYFSIILWHTASGRPMAVNPILYAAYNGKKETILIDGENTKDIIKVDSDI